MKEIIIVDIQNVIMNQQTIITIIASVLSIIGTLATVFVTKWVDTYFKVYPPDIKKHISFIKKLFRISVAYIIPILSIVVLMVYYKGIDKFFVLNMAINFSLIVIGTTLFLFELQGKRELKMIELNRLHFTLTNNSSDIITDIVKQDVQIVETLKKHTEAIDKIVGAIQQLESRKD